MNSENVLIQKLDPLDIVIHHVGGVGGYGPVKKVINAFPKHVVAVCFEANPSPKDLLIQQQYTSRGVRTLFVPKCIGEKHGRHPFYINKRQASSSIFPPGPSALDEHVVGMGVHTWRENCEVDRVVELDTVTLDELMQERTIPRPDILSMDSQGSELPIMRGSPQAMASCLSVICEVDFIEIYDGQALFPAQQMFLSDAGFRLADILNPQYWHPGPAAGKGFLTVGEALYLRTLKSSSLSLPQLIKLAAIAWAFDRVSYSSKVITLALEQFGKEAELLLSDPEFKPMLDAQRYMQAHQDDYVKDIRFFYRRSLRERVKDLSARAGLATRIKLGALGRYIKKFYA